MREGLIDHLILWFCFPWACGTQTEQTWISLETSTDSVLSPLSALHVAENGRCLYVSSIPTSDFISMTCTLKPTFVKLCMLIARWPVPYFEQVNAMRKYIEIAVSWYSPATLGGKKKILEKVRASLLLLLWIFLNWWATDKRIYANNDYVVPCVAKDPRQDRRQNITKGQKLTSTWNNRVVRKGMCLFTFSKEFFC